MNITWNEGRKPLVRLVSLFKTTIFLHTATSQVDRVIIIIYISYCSLSFSFRKRVEKWRTYHQVGKSFINLRICYNSFKACFFEIWHSEASYKIKLFYPRNRWRILKFMLHNNCLPYHDQFSQLFIFCLILRRCSCGSSVTRQLIYFTLAYLYAIKSNSRPWTSWINNVGKSLK